MIDHYRRSSCRARVSDVAAASLKRGQLNEALSCSRLIRPNEIIESLARRRVADNVYLYRCGEGQDTQPDTSSSGS